MEKHGTRFFLGILMDTEVACAGGNTILPLLASRQKGRPPFHCRKWRLAHVGNVNQKLRRLAAGDNKMDSIKYVSGKNSQALTDIDAVSLNSNILLG